MRFQAKTVARRLIFEPDTASVQSSPEPIDPFDKKMSELTYQRLKLIEAGFRPPKDYIQCIWKKWLQNQVWEREFLDYSDSL